AGSHHAFTWLLYECETRHVNLWRVTRSRRARSPEIVARSRKWLAGATTEEHFRLRKRTAGCGLGWLAPQTRNSGRISTPSAALGLNEKRTGFPPTGHVAR